MTDAATQARQERNAGLLLIAAAMAAMIAANSPWADQWHHLVERPLGFTLPRVGELTPHLFVADGLMAIFFLLVGLEVKREWYEGRLSTPAERRLPIIAAAAGMAVPALIYVAVAGAHPLFIGGWAIPAATDIAFAIGVLAILGRHAPPSIKLLLVTIALVDDIGAVLVIALFYTSDLNMAALGGALVVAGAMLALGRFGGRRLWPFIAAFALMWVLMLASGVHATIAGVLAALTIPLGEESRSPLRRLEHAIHPWVMFGIVPIFGLVSAGVHLVGGEMLLTDPVPLAVLLGLFLGKQIGIFGAIALCVRTGLAPKPKGAGWVQLYGAAVLCGIGFTMSLFIGTLAFPGDQLRINEAKLGTLAGSLLSAIVGYAVLRLARPVEPNADDVDEAAEIFAADEPD
jgi:NhaA family Na+:H+ antiporter